MKLIEGSGLRIIPALDLNDAAAKAVGVAAITSMSKRIGVGVKFIL